MPRGRTILALLGAAGLLAGCAAVVKSGTADPAGSTARSSPSVVAATGIAPGHYRSAALTGHVLVSGTVIDLRIHDSQLSAGAGCNTMSGGFATAGSTLTVASMSTTEMGCAANLMAQDNWLGALFAAGFTAAPAGPGFVLTGKGASITFAPVVNAPLEGTQWYLISVGRASGAATSPQGLDVEIQIVHGVAILASGCNPGNADVSVGSSVVSFGPVSLSSMACMQDARTEMQDTVSAFLSKQALTYSIDGDLLTLTARDGASMVFSTRGSADAGTSPVSSASASAAADSSASLSGTWRVTGVHLPVGGDQVPSLPASITFGGRSGAVAFTTYCDKGTAQVAAAGGTLTFSSVQMPLRPCPSPPSGPAAAVGQPRPVAFIDWPQILARPLHYVQIGRTLSLSSEGLVVNLTAAP